MFRPTLAFHWPLLAAASLVLANCADVAGGSAPTKPLPGAGVPVLDPGPGDDPIAFPAVPLDAQGQAPGAPVPFVVDSPAVAGEVPAAAGVPTDVPSLDAKILLVAATRDELQLKSAAMALQELGTPYQVWIATERKGQLTPEVLATQNRGHFQGVILTSASLGIKEGEQWVSALSPAEWEALKAYELRFKIRQATWYTWPSPADGFQPGVDHPADAEPIVLRATKAGAEVFGYLNTAAPLVVKRAHAYLAKPLDGDTTPLLEDAAGHALVAIKRHPDGRENLAVTFDGNPQSLHTAILSFGVIHWVAKGLLLGDRQTTVCAQVDDLLYPTKLFNGGQYRMSGEDLQVTANWQKEKALDPVIRGTKLEMVFNGEGSSGNYAPDTLTPMAQSLAAEFPWVSHTYTHFDLNIATAEQTTSELVQNNAVAARLGFPGYSGEVLVTGRVSGLKNPAAMKAAYEAGVRYVVSDTSRPGEDNPSANIGLRNWHQSGIYMIPRRPVNLFFNVSTPQEWVEEYNNWYRSHWGFDVDYAKLLDIESDILCAYMLRGELNPWMFHQANLRAYDGKHTLLTDLLDRTYEKYKAFTTLPVSHPSMGDIGRAMQAREAYNAAGVAAVIVPGKSITLAAKQGTKVPVIGLMAGEVKRLGAVNIGQVGLQAGQALTLPLTQAP